MGSQRPPSNTAVSVLPLTNAELAQMSDEDLRAANDMEAALVATHQGRLAVIVGEIDRRQAFRADGATSTQAWLVGRNGLSAASARSLVRVAERLFDLPHLSDALSAGRVSFDKVRAVAGVATPESDADLAEAAAELSVRDLAELVRSARRPGGGRDPLRTRSPLAALQRHPAHRERPAASGRLRRGPQRARSQGQAGRLRR